MVALYAGKKITAELAIKFLQRRCARVVPLYLLVVAVSFLANGRFSGAYPVTGDNLLEHLTFYKSVSVLWSVPIEIHFYVLFLLVWLVASLLQPALFLVIILFTASAFLVLPAGDHNDIFNYVQFFLLGAAVAVGYRAKLIYPSRKLNIAFILSILAIFTLTPRNSTDLFGFDLGLWHNPFLFILVAFLLVSALGSSIAGLMLGGRIGRFVGEISYSIYLLHLPIMIWLAPYFAANTFMFLFVFLGSVGIASWASYRWIERPSRDFINRIGLSVLAETSVAPKSTAF